MKLKGLELALEDMLVGKYFLGLLCLEPFWVTRSCESKTLGLLT